LLSRLKAEFYIGETEKPKGRLNAFQKDELYGLNALLDPTQTFHDLHVCHKKGRDGSPTYDLAGFELDFDKVDNWMRPKSYNKRRIVRGAEKAVEKAQSEEKNIFELFFTDKTKLEHNESRYVEDRVKDHISKDLGVPWHQIDSRQARIWRDTGYEPFEFGKWWHEPNETEKARLSIMLRGASLRKNL
jgi:hypothetical protein